MHTITPHIKAIIFDLDGTIIQSNHHYDQAIYELITSRGITSCTKEQEQALRDLAGTSNLTSAIIIKNLFAFTESIDELNQEIQERASRLFAHGHTPFIEGFEHFHRLITKYTIKSGIATNADDFALSFLCEKHNLPGFFGTHIYNFTKVNHQPKPDPALFLYTAQQLECDPQECIVFEDSVPGFNAAQAAGMKCIAIKNTTNQHALDQVAHAIDSYHEAVNALQYVLEHAWHR